jgi:hypothetical protein
MVALSRGELERRFVTAVELKVFKRGGCYSITCGCLPLLRTSDIFVRCTCVRNNAVLQVSPS